MSEHLFEFISISILIFGGTVFYFLMQKKESRSNPEIAQATLGVQVKNGYLSMIELLYHNCDKADLEREIGVISIQRTDHRYIGGYTGYTNEFDADTFILDYFYELINYVDSQNKNFIFTVDSRLNIEKFNNKLRASLSKISPEIEFPILPNNELEDILLTYQKKLNEYKIQMSYLSDGSDSYYFLLHPLNKEKAVKQAIKNIGLQNITLSKINN